MGAYGLCITSDIDGDDPITAPSNAEGTGSSTGSGHRPTSVWSPVPSALASYHPDTAATPIRDAEPIRCATLGGYGPGQLDDANADKRDTVLAPACNAERDAESESDSREYEHRVHGDECGRLLNTADGYPFLNLSAAIRYLSKEDVKTDGPEISASCYANGLTTHFLIPFCLSHTYKGKS
jgi:hypothetical protein